MNQREQKKRRPHSQSDVENDKGRIYNSQKFSVPSRRVRIAAWIESLRLSHTKMHRGQAA